MFTGIIETKASVISAKNTGKGVRLAVKPESEFTVSIGESVSVNGVCLTVTEHNSDIHFDVSPETLKSTNLGDLGNSSSVNLERALMLSDRLGGHIVTGHVDGTGKILKKRHEGEYTFYTFECAYDILNYIIKKGSVAVDGISLTVTDFDSSSFSVAIIPHTLRATNIGEKGTGDRINIEADILGKYIERLLNKDGSEGDFMQLLRTKGFVND